MFSSVLVFLPLTSFGVRASKNIWKQLVPEVTCLTICLVQSASCLWDFKFSRRRVWSSDLSGPWWWRQHVPLKRRSTVTLHGSTSQKTNLNIILFVAKMPAEPSDAYIGSYVECVSACPSCAQYRYFQHLALRSGKQALTGGIDTRTIWFLTVFAVELLTIYLLTQF
jgi:hypothetical protein